MKKSEFATFVAYVAMFGVAILIGMVWLRTVISANAHTLGIPYVLLVILSLIAGVLLNALLIESGHLLGAKLGKYEVLVWNVLFVGFKKKNGKKKWGLSSFEGFTGETKVKPLDVEKSSLSGYIAFPLLWLLIEVVACAIMIAISKRLQNTGADFSVPGIAWMEIFAIVLLGTAAMLYVYNIFPAKLDTVTDGYLAVILSKKVNKVAYNNMLLADAVAYEGGQPLVTPVYDEVTDFTYRINLVSVYRLIGENKPREAIAILNKAIETERGLSQSSKHEALALKLSLLLASPNQSEAKTIYNEMDDETKKYISSVASMPALRCYLLISGVIENADNEANFAIDKVEKVFKDCEKFAQPIEKRLIESDIAFIMNIHPTWKLYELPWQAKPEEEKPEEPAAEEEK